MKNVVKSIFFEGTWIQKIANIGHISPGLHGDQTNGIVMHKGQSDRHTFVFTIN